MKQTTDCPGSGVVRFSPSEEVYIVCSYRLRSQRYRHAMYYSDDEYRCIKDEARRAVRSVLRRRRGEKAASASSEEGGENFTSMGVERLLMTRAEREELRAGKKRTIRAVLEEQERQRDTASFPDADAIAEVCLRESLPAREAALSSGMDLADELLLEQAAEQAAKKAKAETTTGDGSNPPSRSRFASGRRRRRRRRRSLSDGAISARLTERASDAGETAGGVSDAVVRVRSFSNPKPRPCSSPASPEEREATRSTVPPITTITDDVLEAKFANNVSVVDKHHHSSPGGVQLIAADARHQQHNKIDLHRDRRSQ